nr:hypothetical protein [Microlunatus kandeliicorticis]
MAGLRSRLRAPAVRTVAQAWLASRGLIALVALLLALQGYRLGDQVSNWDVQHFVALARGGYLADPSGKLMAFFPGLPLLLRGGLLLGVPVQVTGIVLATAGSIAAAAALARLGGPWAAVAWLFAPTAVFTTVPYTESLFCAAAFWAWERARADRWVAAAVLAGLACTVRVSGLFLVGALVVMIITSRRASGSGPSTSAGPSTGSGSGWGLSTGSRHQRSGVGRKLALMLLPTAVLAGFATYLHTLTGSWTAWYHAQSTGWVRSFTWPWQSFLNTIPAIVPGAYADHPYWAWVFRGEMASMAIGVGVTVWCLVRRRWAEASWVGVQVLAFSLSYWFFSVNRALLLWFPLWIMLAEWGRWRPRRRVPRVLHRTAVVTLFVAGAVLMLWWSWLFFTGHWAS